LFLLLKFDLPNDVPMLAARISSTAMLLESPVMQSSANQETNQ